MTARTAICFGFLLSTLLACDSRRCFDGDDAPGEGAGDAPGEAVATFCAAGVGGVGGNSGTVTLITTTEAAAGLRGRLDDVVIVAAGDGGLGGLGPQTGDAASGVAGEPERAPVDVVVHADFSFDAESVPDDAVIDIVPSGQATVSLSDLLDPPSVSVSELRVRAGATLHLSCDARIVAQTLVIEAGASLVLRATNRARCGVAFPAAVTDAGMPGSKVAIEAAHVQLDGTIDVSGADGAPGQPGGSGGGLSVVFETIALGPQAQILATGGKGGDGADETPC